MFSKNVERFTHLEISDTDVNSSCVKTISQGLRVNTSLVELTLMNTSSLFITDDFIGSLGCKDTLTKLAIG